MAPGFRMFLVTILNPMLFAPQSSGGESILFVMEGCSSYPEGGSGVWRARPCCLEAAKSGVVGGRALCPASAVVRVPVVVALRCGVLQSEDRRRFPTCSEDS